jgi:glycosyltransferase involved in cell wall biosynthesis
MDICIVAPIASADVAHLLDEPRQQLPPGYGGAPLTGVLIEEMLRQGHSVHALTLDYAMPVGAVAVRATGERFTFEILPGRRRAWRIEAGRPGRALDLFRDERRALTAAIRAAAPQVVHAHWTYEFALAALDSGFPHVITAHDSPRQIARYTRSPYRLLRWLMAREVFRRARCVTAVSPYMAAQVRGMARVPVRVVPNPVSPYALNVGRTRSTPGALGIGMICNGWGKRKNPEPALRAFASLHKRLPRAGLHLFGADFGPGERAQQWAEREGVGAGMRFHGPMPHLALLDALNGLDLLLHPAYEESFGMVVAEAMALGLPVVAGARSGAVPWVAGENQWLVDVRDVEAIALAMATALTAPDAYRYASEVGRSNAIGRFAPAVVANEYLQAYEAAFAARAITPTT